MKLLLLLFCLAAQDVDDPDKLRAEVESFKSEKSPWRQIDWKNCPLEALAESRKSEKPILVWVFLGNPADERC